MRLTKQLSGLALLVLVAGCNDGGTVVGTAVGLRWNTTIPQVAANEELPALSISIVDPIGTVVTSATHQITILATRNAANEAINGTLTRAAVNGVVTFTGLSIPGTGTNYVLIASAPGLSAASSNGFTVTP